MTQADIALLMEALASLVDDGDLEDQLDKRAAELRKPQWHIIGRRREWVAPKEPT